MSTTEVPVPALGVGTIIGDSVRIYFRRIGLFTLLAFLPLVVFYGLSYALLGAAAIDPALGRSTIGASGAAMLGLLVQTFGFVLSTAFLIQAAYDARLDRPMQIGRYIVGVLARMVPLLVCSVIALIGIYVGVLLLVVPGLWLMGVWAVVAPVIVIEGAGIDALGRSANLTQGYRWPIVGTLLLLGIGLTAINLLVSFVVSFVVALLFGNGFGEALSLIAHVVGSAAGSALYFVGIALIYARLREIKEGTGVESLAEVFA